MVTARVLFLGTPAIAVTALQTLAESDEVRLVGVMTQPDRPAGRGKKLKAPPVKLLAQELGLPLRQPERIRRNTEALQFLEEVRPDVMVVVAFGQLLPEAFFSWPTGGALNLHTSLLPQYRGAAPVIRAIENGEQTTGVTIMKIDAGMDTGDILTRRETPIGPDETAEELEARLADLGALLLQETLPLYISGGIDASPQDESLSSLAPLVQKEEAQMNWQLAAQQVHNRVRAFNPRPGSMTRFRGERVKIWRTTQPREFAAGAAGEIVLAAPDKLSVACGQGTALDLLEIQPANRRRLAIADFLNGFSPQVGEFFQ